MMKYVCQFPDFVLRAFLDSFPYVWKLGSQSPVQVYMDYLCWRWKSLELDRDLANFGESAVALARLCIGVQTPKLAQQILEQFMCLDDAAHDILTKELGKTGMEEPYPWGAPSSTEGPCFLCYYGPALLVQHCESGMRPNALEIMAEVYRAGRVLFPASQGELTDCVTLEVAAIKEAQTRELRAAGSRGQVYALVKTTENTATVKCTSVVDLMKLARSGEPVEVLELWSTEEEFGARYSKALTSHSGTQRSRKSLVSRPSQSMGRTLSKNKRGSIMGSSSSINTRTQSKA